MATIRVPWNSAVTNARFASFHGLPVGPHPLSTTPVPLRKSRARHERHSSRESHQRRASVCGSAPGVALWLRFAMRSSPSSAPLPCSPNRRPEPNRHNCSQVIGS
jgi:hypothetical protein